MAQEPDFQVAASCKGMCRHGIDTPWVEAGAGRSAHLKKSIAELDTILARHTERANLTMRMSMRRFPG